MALYQEIMKVPGLSGSWQDRLNTFGQRFYGGNYSGNLNQNLDLLNKVRSGVYNKPTAKPQSKPVIKPKTTQQIQQRRQFSEVLPFEKLFSRDLITGLAESQINPEIKRAKERELYNLNTGLASTGAFRSGRAGLQRQNLADAFERQRKEQVGSFVGNIKDYTTDYYNRMAESYYKNPSQFVMPTLQSMDQFVQQNPQLASMYEQQTNIPTTYNDVFRF